FGPNRYMTRGMFVTVLGRAANADVSGFTEVGFTDVSSEQYYAPYVAWAADNGIVDGFPDGSFAPDQYISREQMAVIMARYLEQFDITDDEAAPEDSQPEDSQSEDTQSEDTQPEDTQTEEGDMSTEALPGLSEKYSDADSISEWAQPGVLICTERGLLTGDNTGCFNPHDNSTRAMCAVLMTRLMTAAGN
ncbi:MAG: S-layer homology domain-containing protein, partial [Oscillospiraceae bacterium]|nr:S-layer homology domain-containing protein [Oscillospiraceae bacterium]